MSWRKFWIGLIVAILVIAWVDSLSDEIETWDDQILSCHFIVNEVYQERVDWTSALQTRTRKVTIGPYPATMKQLAAVANGSAIVLKFDSKFIVIPKNSSYSCI